MCGPRRVSTMFLNRDYEKIFKPFYIINTVFFLRVYSVSHNMVSTISKYRFILTFILNTVLIVSFCDFFINEDEDYVDVYFWIYFQWASTYVIASVLNFIHRNDNFSLIKNLQKVSDGIRSAQDTKRLAIISRVSILFLALYYSIYIVFKLNKDTPWLYVFYWILTSHFAAKMMNMAIILYFLVLKLRRWKSIVARLVVDEDMNENIDLEELKYYLRKIMKSLDLFNKVFKEFILFHIIMTFSQTLTQIEILLIWKKIGESGYSIENHFTMILFCVSTRLLIDIFLCITSEMFYKEVEDTRVKILEEYCQVPECYQNTKPGLDMKHFKKNIVRLIDTNFNKISACGLFTIDATLPMKLGGVITTYTLVLIQFEHFS